MARGPERSPARARPAAAPVAARDPRALAFCAATLGAGVLLHVDRVAPWITLVALACVAWRLVAARGAVRLPPRWARITLTLLLIAAVAGAYRTLNGLAAGSALLVAMGAAKLLETQSRRDQFVVVGASLVLLLAACLDRQTLLRSPLYAAHVWLACTALGFVGGTSRAAPALGVARLAGRTLVLGLPLAIVLFLFFPRLPGSFWAMPAGGSAVTGLSEEMSPGSISELGENDDPAFRVYFDGPLPPPEERYWRGPVLREFDGYTWRRSRMQAYLAQPLEYLGAPYRYRVVLEPQSTPYWFALDVPTGSPEPRVAFTFDYMLVAPQPASQVTAYTVTSHTRTRSTAVLSPLARRVETRLPAARNPRSRQLALDLRARAQSDAAFADAVVELFRRGGFTYTLTPPLLDLDSVDDFLFQTRRGFCGHYASAFVTLMRAAGVPARVVTGYQGGEWNPIGGYLLVRQSSAHAWAEVWLDGRGWVRVDPTAVVAPERLRQDALALMPGAASAPLRLLRSQPWLVDLRNRWDAVNAWWNNRVAKFDLRAQMDLLEKLGFDSPGWQQLPMLLAAGLVGWLAWIAWQLGRVRPAGRRDRLARAYDDFCRRLARAGVTRPPWQGPLDFGAAVQRWRPDLAPQVVPLLERYAVLRYGADVPGERWAAAVAGLERAMRRAPLPRRPARRSGGSGGRGAGAVHPPASGIAS